MQLLNASYRRTQICICVEYSHTFVKSHCCDLSIKRVYNYIILIPSSHSDTFVSEDLGLWGKFAIIEHLP
ncbi:hypothetical protein Plhal710r2_c006g0028891 [Plasmopara halstedii]